ncbi:MAG: hypothetical protein WCD62_21410, partial [Pseudolabrys sp.]
YQLRAKENVMSTILVLNSSVSGVTSVSRILVKEAVSRLLEAEPGATMVHRDLGAVPIPHLPPPTWPASGVYLRRMSNWPPVRCPIS